MKPRTFAHFPQQEKCIVCGTNDDEECVLIMIDGTKKDRIAEAKPVHLGCAVATNYNKELKLVYRRTKL